MKTETEVPVVAKMQSPRPDRLRARIGQAELAKFNAVGSMKDIVAASEEDLFDATDADGSGLINKTEFLKLTKIIKEKSIAMIRKETQQSQMLRVLGFVIAVMFAFLAATIGANIAIVFSIVDMSVTSAADSSTGVVAVKGTDLISRTAVAEEAVPLGLAPVMDFDVLDKVTQLRVSMVPQYLPPGFSTDFDDLPISPDYDEMLKIKYSVTGYVWLSDTRMFFRTDLGDQIHIDNGIAWVKGVDGIEYPACAGNSTCAAFKASGVDLVDLQNRADAALLDEHRRLGDTAEYSIRQVPSPSPAQELRRDGRLRPPEGPHPQRPRRRGRPRRGGRPP